MDPHTRQLLSELPRHPAWQALEKHVAEHWDKKLALLARDIAAGQLDAQGVADIRGWKQGMDFVLKAPGNALKDLNKEN